MAFAFLLVVIQPVYLTKLSTSKSIWMGFMSEGSWGW